LRRAVRRRGHKEAMTLGDTLTVCGDALPEGRRGPLPLCDALDEGEAEGRSEAEPLALAAPVALRPQRVRRAAAQASAGLCVSRQRVC
jgi:hypothetical protein